MNSKADDNNNSSQHNGAVSNSAKAISFMVGAAALVAATTLLAKSLGFPGETQPGLHPLQISAGRFAFALLGLVLFLGAVPKHRPDFASTHWIGHVLRSLCGWLGVTAMFAAAAHMPISDATAISFLSPLVTMVLAIMFLGDRADAKKIVAAVLALIGAALILRPGTDAIQPAGWLALAAAVFMGIEAIFIKRLSDTEPAIRILLINNLFGACVSIAAAFLIWQQPTVLQWVLLASLGLTMVGGQAMFIQAMKRGQASLVIPAFYSVLLFATSYDLVLFEVLPAGTAALGAALIVAGAFILAKQPRDPDAREAEC